MLAYVLTDVHRGPCGKLCLAVVVHLHANLDFSPSRRDHCLGALIYRLSDRNVAAGYNVNNRVLVDAFADGHRVGGLEVRLSPLLDLARDRDAPVPALENYVALPANVIDGNVSVEHLLDEALARIGAEVEWWEARLCVPAQDDAFDAMPSPAAKKRMQKPRRESQRCFRDVDAKTSSERCLRRVVARGPREVVG